MRKMRPCLVPNALTVLDNFINAEECGAILSELQFCFWEPSTVIHRAYDGLRTQLRTDFRSSSTTDQEWFGERLQSLISRVERQLRLALHARSSHLEKWQATRYGRGGRFDYHLDCGFWERAMPAKESPLTCSIWIRPQRGENAFSRPGPHRRSARRKAVSVEQFVAGRRLQ